MGRWLTRSASGRSAQQISKVGALNVLRRAGARAEMKIRCAAVEKMRHKHVVDTN